MANGLCDNYCKDCVYRQALTNGFCIVCNYLLDTGKRRPCPAGEGCTVKIKGKRGRCWDDESIIQWEKAMARLKAESRNEKKERMREVRKQMLFDRMRTLSCAECGKEFKTDHPRKIYCSVQCKNRAKSRMAYNRKIGAIRNANDKD